MVVLTIYQLGWKSYQDKWYTRMLTIIYLIIVKKLLASVLSQKGEGTVFKHSAICQTQPQFPLQHKFEE